MNDARGGKHMFTEPIRAALVVAVTYVIVAAVYIVFSDRAVESLLAPEHHPAAHTLKGWAFVAITGLLLFLLVRRRTQLIERRKSNLLATIHSSPLPIYTLCHNGNVRLWSVAAERVLGWSAEQVIGRPDPMYVMRGDEEADQRLADVRAGRRVVGVALERHRCNGEPRLFSVCASRLTKQQPTRSDEVGEVIVIMQDITELRRREQMDNEREAMSRSMADFEQAVGVIGHELRTPLASMIASAEVLMTEKLIDLNETHELLHLIHTQANRMNEMTNNMLESARLSSGRAVWNWQTVPLADIGNEAIEILNPLLDHQRIQLSCDVDPPDLTMQSDPDAVRRLMLNLAGNAVKHTAEGEVKMSIRSVNFDGQSWIELTVTDTGFGMSREVLDKIGQAFATNEGGMNESVSRGAGLGLSICCRIVAAHDGRIAVASKPGEGTRIVTRLAGDLAGPVDTVSPESVIHDVSVLT